MSELTKIIETDAYLVSKSGSIEPTVRLLDLETSVGWEKLASEAVEYAKSITKKPGKTSILVLAMGASEYYGPNRNGDIFREAELKTRHSTFVTNAHVYKSHVNKDPAKSIGKVIKSFYNDPMHRVELILELDDAKCPEIVSKIRNQQDVAVSMGCRIKYDVCSICGNKAPSRADYCKHLRYELNEIQPDGKVIAADNPNPTFFDISIVWRPADKTGYMLKKVANHGGSPYVEPGESSASLGMKCAAMTRLSSYLRKAADIDKLITGVGAGVGLESDISQSETSLSLKWLKSIAPKVVASYRLMGDSDIGNLSRADFSDVIKSLSDKGVFLMTPEFLDLLFMKIIGKASPVGLSSKLVSLQGSIFSLLAKHPEIPAKVLESGVLDSDNPSDLSKEAAYKVSYRSLHSTPQSAYSSSPTASLSRCTWGPAIIKLAGFAAVVNSAYTARMLEKCEPREPVKLAHLVNVDYSPTDYTDYPALNKLAYLEHRTSDICSNSFISQLEPRSIPAGSINLKYATLDTVYNILGQLVVTS